MQQNYIYAIMDTNFERNLDQEYEQFLEIIRSHIHQLKDRQLASIYSAWIHKLSNCKDNEKVLRNKYMVTLCYQLSKGFIEEPFVKKPTDDDLVPINEPTFSEVSSSEVECLVLDSEDAGNVMSYNKPSKTQALDSTRYSVELGKQSVPMFLNSNTTTSENLPFKNKNSCHPYPTIIKRDVEKLPVSYRHRTHNIISKLQQIKKQNTLLQHELKELKEKSSEDDSAEECNDKVNGSNLYMRLNDSSSTVDYLKARLKEVQGVRNALIDKVQSMQEFIDHLNDLKNQEIEDICAGHRLELINIKSFIKEESKQEFENKLEEQKQLNEVKIKELQDKNTTKDDVIAEKNKIIQQKELEIVRLSEQMKDSKENLHSILKKLVERPNEDQQDQFRIQNYILQNRIIKLEKAKIRCVTAYESKLASLQRERHLVECSLQIQLVRQRAQIMNDLVDDYQNETKKSVDKLESKYQDIVANMQATAIQRRLEDQMAVASILQAASGIRKDSYIFKPMFPKSTFQLRRHKNQHSSSEVATVYQSNKFSRKNNVNENFEDEGCYDELGTLFEKVHVPQRDSEDKARK